MEQSGQPKVSINELAQQMNAQPDEMPIFYDKAEGEFIPIEDRFFRAVEDGETEEYYSTDWEKETFRKAQDIWESDKYVRIPSNFEIHEWEIMKDFCYTVDDENIRDDLLNAIHGRGAFRMFKDKIIHYGIRQDWFDFRDEQFAEIARRWCDSNDLDYTEDQ